MTTQAPRRAVWSEEVPYATLREPRVLGLLSAFGLELRVAVRPWSHDELPALLHACAASGLRVALWPMLGDEDGRWANARNAGAYCDLVRRMLDALERERIKPAEVAVDIEPPIAEVRAMLRSGRGAWAVAARAVGAAGASTARATAEAAAASYQSLCDELRARGVEPTAVVAPFALGSGVWERMLGTPAPVAAYSRVSVMLYTSILEGWSRGWLRRADARGVLARGCVATLRRYGEARAGVSLGAVGVGALGNEPVYRNPEELADDVALARAAGLEDITLFDLGGALARPPAELWLEALTQTAPAPELPAPTPRVRVATLWLAAG
jgi:hypothetical protein